MHIPKWSYTALLFLFLMAPMVVVAEAYRSDPTGVAEGGVSHPAKPEGVPEDANIYTLPKRNDQRISPIQPRNPRSYGNPHRYGNPPREAEGDRLYKPLNPFVIRW